MPEFITVIIIIILTHGIAYYGVHSWSPYEQFFAVPTATSTALAQPSLTEIRDTVTSFNLSIRDLGQVISIFSCQKAHISNNMTAFGNPFLLSPFDSEKL